MIIKETETKMAKYKVTVTEYSSTEPRIIVRKYTEVVWAESTEAAQLRVVGVPAYPFDIEITEADPSEPVTEPKCPECRRDVRICFKYAPDDVLHCEFVSGKWTLSESAQNALKEWETEYEMLAGLSGIPLARALREIHRRRRDIFPVDSEGWRANDSAVKQLDAIIAPKMPTEAAGR